ncbi:MAG: ABC transporter ATP-binding protein [Desulfovibrio sp.]|jgi:phospholipid/cholesterol/gamma-HCH transport system ATP-binding protein|nr:ABC transporter ATP-binding protein [Desulfovibrio sp.]
MVEEECGYQDETDRKQRENRSGPGSVVVALRGVCNRFCDHTVHDNLDLDICRGEILGLIGNSGAGKSVLLRSILGLRPPNAGSVRIMGIEMGKAGEKEKNAVRRRWGVLFQDGALFSSLSVEENAAFPLREFTRLSPALRREIARLKLSLAGLPASAYARFPGELSGGMRKRAGLARALALDPDILFLDEPTAGLDPLSAAAFDRLVRALRDDLRLTVCLVTHDLDTLYAVCDRVAVLADKHIAAVGDIASLLRLDHPWIQEYFNGPRGRAAFAQAAPGSDGCSLKWT